MLEFKKYERTEAELESLGTVLSLIGNKGKIRAIPKNLASTLRVQLILIREDGGSEKITCSRAVSDGLRDKSITLSQILNFELLVGETGVPYISIPATEGLLTWNVADLTPEEYTAPSVSSLEALAI